MEKITQSHLLRCGFEYNLLQNIKNEEKKRYLSLQRKHKNLWNFYFTKTIWVYDWELDGEIQLDIMCFKSFGTWVFAINKTIITIETITEFENLLEIYPDEDLNFIYIIQSDLGYKIGRTKNIDNRGNVFNVKLPFNWDFYRIFAVRKSKKLEKFLHFVLQNQHKNGEWFELHREDLPIIEKFVYNNIN